MRVAALDTSTRCCGVALLELEDPSWTDPVVAFQASVQTGDSRAARLLPLLDLALQQAGWRRTDIDGFVAVRGPGSFTGLRIGLGTVRGLALASGKPCFGIGTLEAMVEAFGLAGSDRVPVIDAGRGEVFSARFDADSSPPTMVEGPWVGPPDRAIGRLRAPAVVFGDGVVRYRLYRTSLPDTRFRPAPVGVAAAAGRLAIGRARLGAADGEGMSPSYVRSPDATEPGRPR